MANGVVYGNKENHSLVVKDTSTVEEDDETFEEDAFVKEAKTYTSLKMRLNFASSTFISPSAFLGLPCVSGGSVGSTFSILEVRTEDCLLGVMLLQHSDKILPD